MTDFVPPGYNEVYSYFLSKLHDEQVSESMARRFCGFYANNGWQIKVGKAKLKPMISWKGTCNTWIRLMPKYSKLEDIKLKSKKLFNES